MLKPLPDDRPDPLRFLEAKPAHLRPVPGVELPVREPTGPLYHARYKSVHAIIAPVPGEIRVPYVDREGPGEFAAFMDRLVERLECSTVRFVNAFMDDDPASDAMDALDDARGKANPERLEDVLHGFEHVQEEWDDHPHLPADAIDGPVDCLVGEWAAGGPDQMPAEDTTT